jgi:xanthine dehydrogenase accessory factor
MKELFLTIKDLLLHGETLVLVIVINSFGSTPRKSGAHMLVGKNGRITGTIGGALPEHLAIEEGLGLIRAGGSAVRDYILHPNEASDIGAKCGGEIKVLLLRLDSSDIKLRSVVERAIGAFELNTPSWLVIKVSPPECAGVAGPDALVGWTGEAPPDLWPGLRQAKAALLEKNGELWFSEPLFEPERVYIFGGGHVAQELAPLLSHLEFSCTIFEDRAEFARPELFQNTSRTVLGNFENIGASITINEGDYIVIVSRGHIWDFHAEAFALKSKAAYIGVIGSKTKHAFVEGRLKEAGFSVQDIKAGRVHAPVGLDIKSETPAEIAVSIAAQMIHCRALGRTIM